jgi:hypothetical protein
MAARHCRSWWRCIVCHFVSHSHAVMTALIFMLPLIVVVDISLQLHQAVLCQLCLLVVLINVKSLTALGFVRAEQVHWTKEHMRCAWSSVRGWFCFVFWFDLAGELHFANIGFVISVIRPLMDPRSLQCKMGWNLIHWPLEGWSSLWRGMVEARQ